jgi:uncharacterized membrane protein YfcA
VVAIDLQFWFLFPVAIGIAVIAMATGVSGANFWVPVYLLWLHLDPQLGFWLSLVSMLIGFSSGVARNLRQGTINFFLLRTSLITALPATVLGAVTARFVHPRWLFLGFAVFVFLYSTRVLAVLLGSGGVAPPKKDHIHWGAAAVGGVLTGLLTVGLGKFLLPSFLRHSRCQSPAEAVGTTVTAVFVASLCASIIRLTPELLAVLQTRSQQLWNILLFVAPGVFIGGQIGPRVAANVSLITLRCLLIGVLYLISGLMFLRFWFFIG